MNLMYAKLTYNPIPTPILGVDDSFELCDLLVFARGRQGGIVRCHEALEVLNLVVVGCE